MKKIRNNLTKRRLSGGPHDSGSLRGLMHTIPLGLHRYQLQPNGDLIFWGGNPAADRILGIDHSALIGQPIEAAFPNLAQADILDAYRQIAQNGGGFERELVTYQDEKVAGIYKIQAFQDRPAGVAVLFQDIRRRLMGGQ